MLLDLVGLADLVAWGWGWGPGGWGWGWGPGGWVGSWGHGCPPPPPPPTPTPTPAPTGGGGSVQYLKCEICWMPLSFQNDFKIHWALDELENWWQKPGMVYKCPHCGYESWQGISRAWLNGLTEAQVMGMDH